LPDEIQCTVSVLNVADWLTDWLTYWQCSSIVSSMQNVTVRWMNPQTLQTDPQKRKVLTAVCSANATYWYIICIGRKSSQQSCFWFIFWILKRFLKISNILLRHFQNLFLYIFYNEIWFWKFECILILLSFILFLSPSAYIFFFISYTLAY